MIASTSEAEPIVPPSFIIKSSTNVTIPPELIVIAPAAEAEPIVPPSLINMSSTNVTIPVPVSYTHLTLPTILRV